MAVVCSGKAWQFKKWPFKVGAAGSAGSGAQRRLQCRVNLGALSAGCPTTGTPGLQLADRLLLCMHPLYSLLTGGVLCMHAFPQGAAEGNLVDTFSRVLGVFVHYTDEQVGGAVSESLT